VDVKLNDEAREFRWVTPEEAMGMALNEPTRRLVAAGKESGNGKHLDR